jgi:hypothetical protein
VKDLRALRPAHHVNLFSRDALHHLARQAGLTPFRVPLRLLYGSTAGPFSFRQLNRAIRNPLKRWRSNRCWQYYRKGA